MSTETISPSGRQERQEVQETPQIPTHVRRHHRVIICLCQCVNISVVGVGG